MGCNTSLPHTDATDARLPVKAHLRAAPMCCPASPSDGVVPVQTSCQPGQNDLVVLHSPTGASWACALITELRGRHGLNVWCPTDPTKISAGFARVSSITGLGEIRPARDSVRAANGSDINTHQVAAQLSTASLGLLVLVTAGSTWDEGVVACLRSPVCKERPLLLLHAPESCPAPNVSDWPVDVRPQLLGRGNNPMLTYISLYGQYGTALAVANLKQQQQQRAAAAAAAQAAAAAAAAANAANRPGSALNTSSVRLPSSSNPDGVPNAGGAKRSSTDLNRGMSSTGAASVAKTGNAIAAGRNSGEGKGVATTATHESADNSQGPVHNGVEAAARERSSDGVVTAGDKADDKDAAAVLELTQPWQHMLQHLAKLKQQEQDGGSSDNADQVPGRLPASMQPGSACPGVVLAVHHPAMMPGAVAAAAALAECFHVVVIDGCRGPASSRRQARHTLSGLQNPDVSNGLSRAGQQAHGLLPSPQLQPMPMPLPPIQPSDASSQGSGHPSSASLAPAPDAPPQQEQLQQPSQQPQKAADSDAPIALSAVVLHADAAANGQPRKSILPVTGHTMAGHHSKHSRSMSMGAAPFAAHGFQQRQRHHASKALGRAGTGSGLPAVPPCPVLRSGSSEAKAVVRGCQAYILFTGYNLGTASQQAGAEIQLALQAGATIHLVCEASFNLLRPDTRNWGLSARDALKLTSAWLQRVLFYADHMEPFLAELSRRLVGLVPPEPLGSMLLPSISAGQTLSVSDSGAAAVNTGEASNVQQHSQPIAISPVAKADSLLARAGSLPAAFLVSQNSPTSSMSAALLLDSQNGGRQAVAEANRQPTQLGLNAVSAELGGSSNLQSDGSGPSTEGGSYANGHNRLSHVVSAHVIASSSSANSTMGGMGSVP